MLPESSRGASYPVPVFEFLNVNELSMDQLVLEEALMLLALKYFKKKKLGMVGEEGFESFSRLIFADLPELPLLALRVIGRDHRSQPSEYQSNKI